MTSPQEVIGAPKSASVQRFSAARTVNCCYQGESLIHISLDECLSGNASTEVRTLYLDST